MLRLAARRPPVAPERQWLKILPPALRWVLHGEGAVRDAAAPVWGVAFAQEPCGSRVQASRATLWLGPDEYLLLDMDGDAGAQLRTHHALQAAIDALPHALVDVSHRQFALEVSGPHAPTVLSGACPLDLDLSEFPVGMCTRTVLAKADIILWRRGEDAFHLEVWRSFGGYVSGILGEIAAQFYGDA